MISHSPRCAKQNTVGDLAGTEWGCLFHCNRYTNISTLFNIYLASDPQCHSIIADMKEEVVSFVVTHLTQGAWTTVCPRATSWVYLNSWRQWVNIGNRTTLFMIILQEIGPGFSQTLQGLVNANFLNIQSQTLEEGSVFAGASGQAVAWKIVKGAR